MAHRLLPVTFTLLVLTGCGEDTTSRPVAPLHPEVVRALKSLDADVDLDDEGNIWAVQLWGKSVSDDDLKILANETSLELLELGNTNVTDRGVLHLRRLDNLSLLGLTNTAVSDSSVKVFVGFENLWCLRIGGTKITAIGVDVLEKALPECSIQTQGGNGPTFSIDP